MLENYQAPLNVLGMSFGIMRDYCVLNQYGNLGILFKRTPFLLTLVDCV